MLLGSLVLLFYFFFTFMVLVFVVICSWLSSFILLGFGRFVLLVF